MIGLYRMERGGKSDAALVAGQIADLTAAVHEFRLTLEGIQPPRINVNIPQGAPATVTVTPEVTAPAVTVNVPELAQAAAPVVTVNVPEAAAPSVNVTPEINIPQAEPRTYDVRITERDANGFIAAFVITPRGA